MNQSNIPDLPHSPSPHLPFSPSRRRFLGASGVALALPLFESLVQQASFARESALGFEPDAPPRRMICICNNLGLHRPFYEPENTGRDYRPSRYLKLIDEFRDDYTVFTGVSLPMVRWFLRGARVLPFVRGP